MKHTKETNEVKEVKHMPRGKKLIDYASMINNTLERLQEKAKLAADKRK